jgi:predicted RNA-binding protein with PIN domain
MLYIIDGYNFLFRLQHSVKDLKKERSHFLLLIDKICEERNLYTQIVFDSNEELSLDYPSKAKLTHIQMIFSPKNKTADDYILEIVRVSKNRYKTTVVTSDLLLARLAEGLGTRWLTVEAFMTKFFPSRNGPTEKVEKKPEKETDRDFYRLLEIFEKKFHLSDED